MRIIRWGIIGAGGIARSFAEDIQALPEADLLAVGSRSLAKANQFASELHIEKAYGSYEELAQDPEIDVIYIATPNVFHHEHSLLCLGNGKSILVEKPFTMNAQEAEEVIAFSRSRQLFCMEAMWMRFIPAMRKVVELVQEGSIGEIQMITASLGFYNSFNPNSRLFDPNLGGGALLDLGVYPLSLIVQLMGRPSSIKSEAKIGATEVDEQVAATLGFSDGGLAVMTSNINAHNRNDALILGSEGSIHIQAPLYRPLRITLNRYRKPIKDQGESQTLKSKLKQSKMIRNMYQGLTSTLGSSQGGESITLACTGNGYGYEASEAGRCMQAGLIESSIMPLDETILVMEIVDAIRVSWNDGLNN